MTLLELPAGLLSERFGEPRLLVFGLLCAGFGYLVVAHAGGFAVLSMGLLIAGAGAGFQHSLSSAVIARTHTSASRRHAMGTYNASGDAGKLTYTGLFGMAVGAGASWSLSVVALAVSALAAAIFIWILLRRTDTSHSTGDRDPEPGKRLNGWGIRSLARFSWLSILVFLDSFIQAVFLTFLAFVVMENGYSEAVASTSVVLALIGGMLGKFSAGWLAAKFGDRLTFTLLQLLTIVGILSLVLIDTAILLILLPVIGLAIQGTSTVTYGSVPEFFDNDRHSRGYALIYTVSSSSSVAGPFLAGALADISSLDTMIWVLALVATLSLPLSRVLRTHEPFRP